MQLRLLPLYVYLLLLLTPLAAWAQDSLTLSVTPTLFDISVDPGQVWQSSIRVINPNPQDLTVYIQPVNFSAQGETGVSTLQPLLETDTAGVTLAEWVEVTTEPIRIVSQETATVPFTVRVPSDAAPGGQFAALLVSTQPPANQAGASQVRTSQAVSALFFMRVEGDIEERGMVRSFRTEQRFVQRPENSFELRFANQGTVHLQPQGSITIYNMWGERRGEIPINQRSQFGKVLPDTVRAFNYSWEGEFSLLDIGRYRADVTVGYGQNERSFASSSTYFWVIPIYGLLVVLGSVAVFGMLLTLIVRAYVRRMLALAGVHPNQHRIVTPNERDVDLAKRSHATASTPPGGRITLYLAPLRTGLYDVRSRFTGAFSLTRWGAVVWGVIRDYKLFMLALVVLIVLGIAATIFIQSVKTDDRAFEVILEDAAESVPISSEELQYQALLAEPEPTSLTIPDSTLTYGSTTPTVRIVNVSGVFGAAAQLRILLEAADYTVEGLSTDLNRVENRSIIVYESAYQEEAFRLSQALNGALMSARTTESDTDPAIVIYLGRDVVQP